MKKTLILAFGLAGILGAQVPDFTPPTPLFGAVLHNNTAEAKRLLAAGADPNEIKMVGFPALFFPLAFRNVEIFHAMVEKGAVGTAEEIRATVTYLVNHFGPR